jgi:hypothetical protein
MAAPVDGLSILHNFTQFHTIKYFSENMTMAKTEKPPLKKPSSNGGARPGAGRPAFVPTDAERKQVEALSGYGLPIEQIAVLVRDGIHVDTLRAHFATELQSGKAKANAQVGKTLFQKVMAGDTTAAIWWSKTQMRWAETQKHELTGADGAPLEFAKIERVIVKNG